MDDGVRGRPDEADEKPLTPEQARLVNHARLAAIVGAVIIFAGFALVLVTILMRLGESGKDAVPSAVIGDAAPGAIRLAPEETVISAATADRYLTVTIEVPGGETVIRIYDLEDLTLIREIGISSE